VSVKSDEGIEIKTSSFCLTLIILCHAEEYVVIAPLTLFGVIKAALLIWCEELIE
jgi:hypothetical protein